MAATNNLTYTTARIQGNKRVSVQIRLNDECKNGHQDFAITADVYERTSERSAFQWVSGGCCHDDILEFFPELRPFVRLHLCDYLGAPMHATANGFYHLRKGFNDHTGAGAPSFVAEYCEYYRITPEQFGILNQSETELQFSIYLLKLGIIDQWKVEAAAAINTLEALTGDTFVVDSTRSEYTAPSQADIDAETERVASGYYSKTAKGKRVRAEAAKVLGKLQDDLDAQLAKAQLEYRVKSEVLKIGGPKALKSCIFYTHTKTLTFNWSRLDTIPETEAEKIISKLQLPEGVTAKIGKPE